MNENLNLCEILKDVPVGTKLWSPACGYCTLDNVRTETFEVLSVSGGAWMFYSDGLLGGAGTGAEVAIFPSKDERDWSKFAKPKEKVKVVLHPFDRVLLRDQEHKSWRAGLLTDILNEGDYKYCGAAAVWKMCIPYNENTAHLLGTTDPCPIDYEIEFSKEYIPR